MVKILDDVKEYCGIQETFTGFDNELLTIINDTVSTLVLLGVSDFQDTYVDANTEYPDMQNIVLEASVRHYLKLKVRFGFDPPSNQSISTMVESTLSNLVSRILYFTDGVPEEVV